jgi:hypothetical protein
MKRNVTVTMHEDLVKAARHAAVELDQSLSQWMADLVREKVQPKLDFETARRRALARMKQGLHLGGKPMSRNELHERR